MVKMDTRPWYNCLAWFLSRILGGKVLPITPMRYVLNYKKPIDIAFAEKVNEFGVTVKKVDSLQELENYQLGAMVYGYYTEEVYCNGYKDYVDSGFHIVLVEDGKNFYHQNGCGAIPTSISMKELQKSKYTDPIYFAVIQEEQE